MAAPITTIGVQALTSTTTYEVKAGAKMITQISGDGSLEYLDADGTTWTAYPDQSALFGDWLPVTGQIRVVVNSGTVYFGMVRADA